MSIFDILKNGSVAPILEQIAGQARSAAGSMRQNSSGGLGGLMGAGALGALLGNALSSDMVKNMALVGAGAVAWNFYQKWATQDNGEAADRENFAAVPYADTPAIDASVAPPADPTALLVIRAMNYAARSDGHIDADEQSRMNAVMENMLPGQNLADAVASVAREAVDPGVIASQIKSPEQARDVYRLSAAVIEPDQFMEKSYLAALSEALGITHDQRAALDAEAGNARAQLAAGWQNRG